MSPRRKAVGEARVEGDKCPLVLYLFSSPAGSLCTLHTAVPRSSNTPEQQTWAQMLLYRTLVYAQQIPSEKYRRSGDVAPPSPRLFSFFATCHSNAFASSISIDRVLAAGNYNCSGAQILSQSPQHHPEEFNMSEPDRKIAPFVTTMDRTSLFHNHLEK